MAGYQFLMLFLEGGLEINFSVCDIWKLRTVDLHWLPLPLTSAHKVITCFVFPMAPNTMHLSLALLRFNTYRGTGHCGNVAIATQAAWCTPTFKLVAGCRQKDPIPGLLLSFTLLLPWPLQTAPPFQLKYTRRGYWSISIGYGSEWPGSKRLLKYLSPYHALLTSLKSFFFFFETSSFRCLSGVIYVTNRMV